MKVSRDDSGLKQSLESDKLRMGASNYHSAIHLRQAKGIIFDLRISETNSSLVDLNNLSSSSKYMDSPTRLPVIGTPVNNKSSSKVIWPSTKSSSSHGYCKQQFLNLTTKSNPIHR